MYSKYKVWGSPDIAMARRKYPVVREGPYISAEDGPRGLSPGELNRPRLGAVLPVAKLGRGCH